MGGRGSQTFKKRQKEQQRRERQQEKFANRLQRKNEERSGPEIESFNPILAELRQANEPDQNTEKPTE